MSPEVDCSIPTFQYKFGSSSGPAGQHNSEAWDLLVPEGKIPLPAYTPKGARHPGNLWNVHSHRLDREVYLYSDFEYHHWLLVESCPQILWYCEKYPKISVKIDGSVMVTLYNMLICYRDLTLELRTLKPFGCLGESKATGMKRHISAQQFWADKMGVPYRLLTEQDVNVNPLYLANWKKIHGHLHHNLNPVLQEKIVALVSDLDQCSLATILKAVSCDEKTTLNNVLALLHQGILSAPLGSQKLSRDLQLWRT